MENILNQFKRDTSASKFKSGYTIANPTHLVNVVNSLYKFPTALSRISSLDKVLDKSLQQEASKLDKMLDSKRKAVLLKIISLENSHKDTLLNILNDSIANNSNLESEMRSLITTQDQALEYATSLGIIDDYIEYLESGRYNGPTTKWG